MKKFYFFQGLFKNSRKLVINIFSYIYICYFFSTLFSTYLYEKAEKENAIKYGFPVQNKAKYLHRKRILKQIFYLTIKLNLNFLYFDRKRFE